MRFHCLPTLNPLRYTLLTRLNQFTISHYGSCVCQSKLHPCGYPQRCLISYMYHSLIYMADSFHSASLAKLAWRTARAWAGLFVCFGQFREHVYYVYENLPTFFIFCSPPPGEGDRIHQKLPRAQLPTVLPFDKT